MGSRKAPGVLDRRFVPAGQLVVEEGCLGNRAFLIESGKVEIFMRDRSGEPVKIAEAGPGAIVGEMALLDDGVRTASIRAIEQTVLVALSARDIEQSGKLLRTMTRLMATRLKETNARFIARNAELADLEEQARTTVRNVTLSIPEGRQEEFRKDMLPLLDRLKSTLNKYQHI
jgi:CRP-like cAMP-binding protein